MCQLGGRRFKACKFVSLVLTGLFVFLVGLNIAYANDTVIAEKKEGKFYATILPQNAFNFAGGTEKSAGFVASAELDLTWWWLFREPVYYHTLRWTLKEAINVELYGRSQVILDRRDLLPYPDLLARYDDLKPSHMEITVDVTLRAMALIKPVSGYGTFFDGGHFRYSKRIKDIELMVVRSGQDGENMSPGTPPDGFREFTSYAVEPDVGLGYGLSKKDIEHKLASTFINTGKVEFHNARISEIQIPNKEIKSIYDTLMYRERGCRKFTDNPRIWTCKEGVAKKTAAQRKNPTEDALDAAPKDAIKEEENNKAQGAASEASSDFWRNGGVVEPELKSETKTKSENIQLPTSDSANFWEDGGQSVAARDSGFWEGEEQSAEAENFRVETRGGTQGVVSLFGETLIPFKPWKVKSYKGGIALVSKTKHDSNSCEVRVVPRALQWSFAAEGWVYSASAVEEGYVGKEGTWLTPPQKSVFASKIRVRGYKHQPYMQVRQDYYERTYPNKYDRLLAKHNRKMSDCKEEVSEQRQRFINTYKSKGYQFKNAK